jgi:hypothetical protein
MPQGTPENLSDSVFILSNMIRDLGDSVKGLKNTFGGLVDTLDEANRSLISVGKAYGPQFDQFQKRFETLPGNVAKNFQIGVDQLKLGFKNVNEAILKQTIEERLTGQNFKQTDQIYRALQVALGYTDDTLTDLSKTILKSSSDYGIQSSKLIEALTPLSPQFLNLELLGTNSADLAKKIATIGATYGEGGAQLVTKFFQRILDTNPQEAYANQMQDVRNQLVRGTFNINDWQSILNKASERTAGYFKSASQSGDPLRVLSAIREQFGETGVIAFQLKRMAQSPLQVGAKGLGDLHATMQGFREEMTNPLAGIYDPMRKTAEILTKWDGMNAIQDIVLVTASLQGLVTVLKAGSVLTTLFGGGEGAGGKLGKNIASQIPWYKLVGEGAEAEAGGGAAAGMLAGGLVIGAQAGLLWLIKHSIDSGVDRQVAELKAQGREFKEGFLENTEVNKKILDINKESKMSLPVNKDWKSVISEGINDSINSALFGISKGGNANSIVQDQNKKLINLLEQIHNQMIQLNSTTENKTKVKGMSS